MKTKNIFLIIVLSSLVSELFSQISYLHGINIENQQVVRENDLLSISMDIVLDEVKIKTNDLIFLTPVLRSNKGNDSRELPPVIICGNRRLKVLERTRKLNNYPEFAVEPQIIVKRNNGATQHIQYRTTLPFALWMGNASFSFEETVTGCADCDRGQNSFLLVERILKEDYVPVYKMAYIIPEVRVDKQDATLSGAVNFIVDRAEILHNYNKNKFTLERVDNFINEIKSLKKGDITGLSITGYASPEGSVVHNKALSERRANAFAGYLGNKHGIERRIMHVTGYGEDWNMLREQVLASSIAHKNDILAIIDDIPDPDARDAELKKLSDGAVYRTLLRDYYPAIRRTEYTVAYEQATAFDPEKAKQTFLQTPEQLTLAEYYLLAQTYNAGSQEFKDLFRVASSLYPDDAIVILNTSFADIEDGNNQAAIDRLSKIEDDPRAWNSLGVAYARLDNLQKAEGYFQKAAVRGDEEARINLLELGKVMGDRK